MLRHLSAVQCWQPRTSNQLAEARAVAIAEVPSYSAQYIECYEKGFAP